MNALEARRRLLMMQEVIPVGYKRIQYAECRSGVNAFIELPFGFYPTDEVEMHGALNLIMSDRFLVAPKTWNNDHNRYALFGTLNGDWTTGFGDLSTGGTRLRPSTSGDLLFHKFAYKDYVYYSEDLGISTDDLSATMFGSETVAIRLFFGYNSVTPGKIAYYKHKKANGTVVNIIPIQHKVTGVVEMYDTVSKTIMPRSGTLYAPE